MTCHFKVCFKCGLPKDLTAFYRHPMMADGRLGKCKECAKLDANDRRQAKLEKIREYDRRRANLPHRQALRLRIVRAWHKRYPDRANIHLKAQRKYPKPPACCERCHKPGRLERHHPDYAESLKIEWLCKPCHWKADEERRAKEVAA